MKSKFARRNLFLICWSALFLLITWAAMAWSAPLFADDNNYVDGQVVVKVNVAGGATIEGVNATYGTTILDVFLESAGIYLLQLAPNHDVETIVEIMQNDPRLIYAEPNFFSEIPEGDPSETWAWGGYDPNPYLGQYAIAMLNLAAAHEVTLGSGAVVAVLDTGIQVDHPRLADRLTEARYDYIDDDPIPEDVFNGLDDDGDGLIDEGAGHGTHVAGIVNLVAPEAQIMPLRVLDSEGRGNDYVLAEAVQFAVQNGAQVINLSLGMPAQSELMEEVIAEATAAGVLVVAAAGNLDSSSEQYPASNPQVIAVTSVGPTAAKSYFANYGEWVDIAAPGESITSTFPVDGYAQWSGTSMATPFVAAQAALIRSVQPTLLPAGITTLIQSSAQPIDEENPNYVGLLGAGLANIGASVAPSELLYVSSSTAGVVNGVSFADEDILTVDVSTGLWAMYFDGSDVGLAATDIDAFDLLSTGDILLSLDSASFDVPGVGVIDDSDIVRFTPTSLGADTAGVFAMFFDGSDVGLDTDAEDVDAIALTPAGQLLLSMLGNASQSIRDEDLLRFTPTSLGWETSGSWAMYFDGSDVGLVDPSENVWGAWVDAGTGDIHLSARGAFAVPGVTGDGADVFVCTPGSLGSQTTCAFGPGLYWDGSADGFGAEILDGIAVGGANG